VAAATSAFMIGVTAAASSFLYFGRGDVAFPLSPRSRSARAGKPAGRAPDPPDAGRSLKVIMAACC